MERHSMRQVREVLRLRFECGQGQRAISAAIGISKGSVSDYLKKAEGAGLTWALASGLSNAEVEQRLFQQLGRNEPPARAPIDVRWIHGELPKLGVTLQQLWVEYADAVAAAESKLRPYQYSQFCDIYAGFRSSLSISMRQVHRAGEKLFIDYSGKKPRVVDRQTGEATEVELFVAVLGASNYTFAEATRTQTLPDFVGSTVRAFEYFGGVPQVVVPDQLKSAVKKSDRYTPEINETYAELARHYDTVIIPARPRRPKDKAKVEVGVQIAQRWILAVLRNRTFFSIGELNAAIAELLEKLNQRPFKKLEGCRRSAFESIDRPAMKMLPATRYTLSAWKQTGVKIDHHIEFDDRNYSVDHTLIGGEVEVRATATTVEILHGGERVALHERSYGPKGTATTIEAHRPRAHREYGAWTPTRLVAWAATVGPATAAVLAQVLATARHPELGRKSCMALGRSAKRYGPERMEAACRRALAAASPTTKSIETILATGLDRVPLLEVVPSPPPVAHENIRGGEYFDRHESDPDRPQAQGSQEGTGK